MALSEAYAMTYSTFLFFTVMVIALLFGGGGAFGVVQGGLWATVRWIVSMIPYLLLGWGFVMSLMTLDYAYLIPSLIGGSSLLTCMASAFVFGKFLPMFVVSTSAILTYYTYDLMVLNGNGNPMKNVSAAVGAFLVLLAQVICTKASPPGTYIFNTSLYNDGLAALFGLSLGLSGWISTSASSPELLPYTGNRTKASSTSEKKSSVVEVTSTTPEQTELVQVNKDVEYLRSVGITDPNSNATLKKLTDRKKELESKTHSNVMPVPTK